MIVNRAGTRLLDVHFAAHADVWRYDADVPQIVDDRVKVYLANGDHAAYPRRCTHLCRQSNPTLPEAHFGGQISWIGNSAAGCHRRCVRLLPAGANGAPASWNAWDGRWGAPTSPAFAPPQTPAFQKRFKDPFAAKHSGRHLFDLLREGEPMPLIHTCYRILEIDRSVAFYEALGFREVGRIPIRDEAINVFMNMQDDGDSPRWS